MPYLDVNYTKRKKGHEVQILEKPKIPVVVYFHYNPAAGTVFWYPVAIYIRKEGRYSSRSNYYVKQAAQRPYRGRQFPLITL